MQANTITLPVDYLNNGTTTDEEYRRSEEFQNRSLYKGPVNSLVARDTLGFYRTANKKSGNYNGSAKCSAKFTMDMEVPGVDSTTTVTAPFIFELSASIPVGVSSADQLKMRQRALALLDNDTVMNLLMGELEI